MGAAVVEFLREVSIASGEKDGLVGPARIGQALCALLAHHSALGHASGQAAFEAGLEVLRNRRWSLSDQAPLLWAAALDAYEDFREDPPSHLDKKIAAVSRALEGGFGMGLVPSGPKTRSRLADSLFALADGGDPDLAVAAAVAAADAGWRLEGQQAGRIAKALSEQLGRSGQVALAKGLSALGKMSQEPFGAEASAEETGEIPPGVDALAWRRYRSSQADSEPVAPRMPKG